LGIIIDEWLFAGVKLDRDHLICGDANTAFHIWRKKDAAYELRTERKSRARDVQRKSIETHGAIAF
jgi:hypothetical protein